MNKIKYIKEEELEVLARRVWYAKYPKGSRAGEIKRSSFEDMGLNGMSTEFPMLSGRWKRAGNLEIMVTYPKWDIPALINVRRAEKVCE